MGEWGRHCSMNLNNNWQIKNQENCIEWFCNNKQAVDFINGLFYCVEFWDDLIDKDQIITNEKINECMQWLFLSLPSNDWFIHNRASYLPIMKIAINAFYDANSLADNKRKHLKNLAFHLRNTSTEIIIMTTYLCGGEAHLRAYSENIRQWYAFEKFDDWNK